MQSQVTAPSNINGLSINERRPDILICAELFIPINKTHLDIGAGSKSMRCALASGITDDLSEDADATS